VVPQLSSGWQHNYSTKNKAGNHANKQSMYSLLSMGQIYKEKFDILNFVKHTFKILRIPKTEVISFVASVVVELLALL
jgi:hypothetical protein